MTYHAQLLKAYEGEVIGQTFFSALSHGRASFSEKQTLQFLAGLEVRTAGILHPLIERYNLTPRSGHELNEEGLRDAGKYAGLEWGPLNARFAADFPPYADEFLAIERMAPEQDLSICKLVTAHEIALIAFAREEVEGTGLGMSHLLGYVAQIDSYNATCVATSTAAAIRP